LNVGRRAHIDESKAYALPHVHALCTPSERPATVILLSLKPEHRHAHLESQFLLVGDVRLVHQIDVTDADCLDHGRTESAYECPAIGLFDRLSFGRDLEHRDFRVLLVHIAVEPPGYKAVAIRVDQVSRNVFTECDARRPWQ
jgi:hypothetical protein